MPTPRIRPPRPRLWTLPLIFALAACHSDTRDPDEPGAKEQSEQKETTPVAARTAPPDEQGEPPLDPEAIRPPVAAEDAPEATKRLEPIADTARLLKQMDGYFGDHIGRRMYIRTDKPMYKPGETIWISLFDLRAHDLKGEGAQHGHTWQLVSPKGAIVLEKRVRAERGRSSNDFEIPKGVQGGEYTLRINTFDGRTEERPVLVSVYEPPRIKKKLEFVRKAYGPGDDVSATIEIKRPTGEPLPNHPLRGQIMLDGLALDPVGLTTDAHGVGTVRFKLPEQISRGDALLTVLVDDGGITESISRRVPIVLKKLSVSFFPEGGQMVEGLPTRLYFEAKNTLGKPADVEGRIIDETGQAVATFSTFHKGVGKVAFTPGTGKQYRAKITRPVGITETYPLPLVESEGCALKTFDDPDSQADAVRVAVQCSEDQTIVVAGVMRERLVDVATVKAGPDNQAIVYLTPGALIEGKDDQANEARDRLKRAQGVMRVTVFDEQLNPMAERLVYRHRRGSLQVEIEPDQEAYTPREQVALKVTTTDLAGNPVPADLALSVVDDTVVSFADDKEAHLISRVFLEPELPGDIEEPNFFFDLTEEKSAVALELLMGTRGWRKFEWRPVMDWRPKPPRTTATATGMAMRGVGRGGGAVVDNLKGLGYLDGGDLDDGLAFGGVPEGMAPPAPAAAPGQPRPPAAKPAAGPMPDMPVAAAKPMPPPPPVPPMPEPEPVMAGERAKAELAEDMADEEMEAPMEAPLRQRRARRQDRDWAGAKAKKKFVAQPAWAPVRVYPAPDYSGVFEGARTDFRETVHWAPSVKTGRDGQATVTFWLSDAVTSFRVFAEGTGSEGAYAGRLEKVITSKLPFSMSVKLPLAVSAGDEIRMPLTLTNETGDALPVDLKATFGELLTLKSPTALEPSQLEAEQRRSLYYPIKVSGQRGSVPVRFAASAGGLSDEFERTIEVEPRGFPQMVEMSGAIKGGETITRTVTLGGADDGTIAAGLKLYPSPVATLVSGLDGLIREPHGCFEQTSSTNYPNVMVLQYLKQHDVADPALLTRTKGLLDRGYNRLVGFETKDKGYEWFGSSPPHEALTAYGLLEFADMRDVTGGVDEAMMARTAAWLKSRRNGKGGFKRDSKALDSFGRAEPEVTDAYITWSVVAAGYGKGFGDEIGAQAQRALATDDAYVLALAANTLLSVPGREGEGRQALKKLKAQQAPDGAWKKADHSITRSRGNNLHIETTALTLLALMADTEGGHSEAIRKGVTWLQDHRGGYGQWGATQATVLALKAMTTYAEHSRRTRNSGSVIVKINGKVVGEMAYEAGRKEPLDFHALGAHFKAGENTLEITHKGKDELPFSLAVDYRATQPATHPEAPVTLKTSLARNQMKMGEAVRLTAVVSNPSKEGLPMALARVGLPGGLTFQNWQLKELVEKGEIAFFETRAREVVIYFRQMKPEETRTIPLDLVATVPGRYTGPASSAYLYYTDDQRFWAKGLEVEIDL